MFYEPDVVTSNTITLYFTKTADCCQVKDNGKGMSTSIFRGIMTFITAIVAIIHLSRNIPSKLSETAMYCVRCYYSKPKITGHAADKLPPPPLPITSDEYLAMKKRMSKLEEMVSFLMQKHATMPPEKEEMLNAALSRVGILEEELWAAKKALREALDKQAELQTYIDKKKKRKKFVSYKAFTAAILVQSFRYVYILSSAGAEP
ncbi:hypothetical protein J1N35_042882 [Gossypium stocksii]|uniref:Uncharacterized protein n=1 Tax=Gossypium stocksii TaxID=47602 RepID=A0A9D3U6C1_9ROSI|nr:hypothetical protein J1N35_042882 [Gossypium stocksii]